jgi:hypothetical protein
VGLEPTSSRAEIEKYFVRFLVQVKIVEFAFEINWPLQELAAQKVHKAGMK